MKNKVINAAVCDTRKATEESFAGFDKIIINAAVLIQGVSSSGLFSKYPVTLNVSNIIEIPDGQNITVKSINGKGQIGPNSNGTGIFLAVNGKLFIDDGSLEAVKSYYRISVNGKVVMPKSYEGQFSNIHVNGKAEYYPDGATILKADTEIDELFILRASNRLYYSSGNLFFLDTGIDTEKIAENGLRFAAKKIVIAKSLIGKLVPIFDEETEIVAVPDGAMLISGDLDLKQKTIRKYGNKICVTGDVSIKDADVLSSLEFLYADGTVSISKELEEPFDMIKCVAGEIRIINTDLGYITDRLAVKIGNTVLDKYPGGVRIEDCAKVTLSDELTPDVIMDKIYISDCAIVICTKEQEEAVSMITEDVAMIKTSGQNGDEDSRDNSAGNLLKEMFANQNDDNQVINASEYVM
ncbi:MAG: hypothetical protein J5850_01645 [Clostridia bacterium]|nr:hypothetical protein [Clostridia bacterium]